MSVGDDDVLANVVEELGESLHVRHNAGFGIQYKVLAVISLDNAGLDIRSAGIGAGVHMGDEADGGHRFVGVRGEGGIDVSHTIHLNFSKPETLELVYKMCGQGKLFVGAGSGGAFFTALCVESHIR